MLEVISETPPPNVTGGCNADHKFVVELCSLPAAKQVSTDMLHAGPKHLVGESGFEGI